MYTDGACSHNGGWHGTARAGVGVHWPHAPDRDMSVLVDGPKHSNNVAELQAIRHALHAIARVRAEGKDGPAAKYVIRSDSMYAIDALTKWWHKWQRVGYPPHVQNKDLIGEIVALLTVVNEPVGVVAFKYVAGHSESVGNAEADRLARLAVTGSGVGGGVGTRVPDVAGVVMNEGMGPGQDLTQNRGRGRSRGRGRDRGHDEGLARGRGGGRGRGRGRGPTLGPGGGGVGGGSDPGRAGDAGHHGEARGEGPAGEPSRSAPKRSRGEQRPRGEGE